MADRQPAMRSPASSCVSAGAVSQAPTTAEDEAVTFASDLIRIDTSNRGGGGCRERPAAEYVAERLAAAGLDPVLLEAAPGRANEVARIAGPTRQPVGCLRMATWTWSRPSRATGPSTRSLARSPAVRCTAAGPWT
jgi:hypothetical protein